eukprot:7221-Pleurochrysis_carterae.AAC.1
MTWYGKACLPRRRCPVASGSNSTVRHRQVIDMLLESCGQARRPVLWRVGPRQRGAAGRPRPVRGA